MTAMKEGSTVTVMAIEIFCGLLVCSLQAICFRGWIFQIKQCFDDVDKMICWKYLVNATIAVVWCELAVIFKITILIIL